MAWYVDGSAFLKLIIAEDESDALRAWWRDHEACWSSWLLATEVGRAATCLDVDQTVVAAGLRRVTLVLPAASTFQVAGTLRPLGLRSLDALHLATAIELGDDLEGLATYDGRLAEAARLIDITVVTPR